MTKRSFALTAIFTGFLSLSSIPVLASDSATAEEETTDVTLTLDRTLGGSACTGLREGYPCKLEMSADSSNCRVRFREITITSTVQFDQWGRSDSHRHTYRWTGDECKPRYLFPISSDIRGGKVSLAISYRMSNGQSGSAGKTTDVIGVNPWKDDIRAEAGNLTYSVLLYRLSRLEQFDANGLPKLWRGFGVGALTAPGASQIWDWKQAVAIRKKEFDDAFATARSHPTAMRSSGFNKLPDFTEEQVKLQALQSLAGQSYFTPNADGTDWMPAVQKRAFADNVVKMEADILAGNPPANW